MLKKFFVMFLLAASTVVFLPASSNAATADKPVTATVSEFAPAQLNVQIGGRQRRGRRNNMNRGRSNNNRRNWNRRSRRNNNMNNYWNNNHNRRNRGNRGSRSRNY
jgi:hypothetical protein